MVTAKAALYICCGPRNLAHTPSNINMAQNIIPQKRDRSPSAEDDGFPDKRRHVNIRGSDAMLSNPQNQNASPTMPVTNYSYQTVVELKSLAKKRNIYLGSHLRKPDIIAKILEADAALVNGPPSGTTKQGCQALTNPPEQIISQRPKVILPIEERIKAAKAALREHIGAKEDGSEPDPRKPAAFFLEIALTKELCCCPGCPKVYVEGGACSIVVIPGLWNDEVSDQARK